MSTGHIASDQLQNWVEGLFRACSVSPVQASEVARNMVWSELVERRNFGVLRIPVHVKRLEKGVLNPVAKINVEQTGPASATIDADNGFGHYAGMVAMNAAVDRAREGGVGIVTVHRSNWYGTGAYFVNLAADAGLIAIAMSNSFPKVVAHGGTLPVFGTNPFAFSAPQRNGNHILVDFATSGLAGSTVRQLIQENRSLQTGQAVMPDGAPITDPKKIGEGALTPFGGAKGFGLALMVEILAGVISGAGFSHGVKSTYSNFSESSDSGHCMIAIDPKRFLSIEDYHARMDALTAMIRASIGAGKELRLPGEVRWENYRRNSKTGISIPAKTIEELDDLASRYGVQPLMA